MTTVRVLAAIVVSLCFWSTGASRIGRRRKRIVYGCPLENERDPPAYSAIRYTVWIGNGRLFHNKLLQEQEYQFQFETDAQNMACTGVLLTPDVVQVPCGCIATFLGFETINSMFKAVPMTLWENRYEIFFSEVELKKMNWFILAKYYIIYHKCEWLTVHTYRDEGVTDNYIIHDYGLIVLHKEITYYPAEISYAPTPSIEDIITYYHQAMRNEYVCLFFGYGDTLRTNSDDGSDVLHYGWRSLMNYQDCYVVTIEATVNKSALPLTFDYKSDATWVCAKYDRAHTIKEAHAASKKDQGGPVTCGEEYFGFISKSIIVETSQKLPVEKRPRFSVTLVNPIVFTLWENSVNYRTRFIKELKTKLKGAHLHPDPFDTHMKFHPTEHLFALSRSPAISVSIIYSTFYTLMFKTLP